MHACMQMSVGECPCLCACTHGWVNMAVRVRRPLIAAVQTRPLDDTTPRTMASDDLADRQFQAMLHTVKQRTRQSLERRNEQQLESLQAAVATERKRLAGIAKRHQSSRKEAVRDFASKMGARIKTIERSVSDFKKQSAALRALAAEAKTAEKQGAARDRVLSHRLKVCKKLLAAAKQASEEHSRAGGQALRAMRAAALEQRRHEEQLKRDAQRKMMLLLNTVLAEDYA
eukprot:m.180179 g.180179  ORF g.180179 m.180179 type:complete len:229 (-) comp10463_c0_seq5:78-764(-)